ncbi:MAG TPA: hypothetical protein VFT64_06175 [Rickettsiales bacterium]|nr:hypothetical protein [Rickettsiales bacterium]
MRYVSLKTQIVLVSIVEGVIAVDILAVMFRVKVLFCGINSALALGNVYIVLAMLGIPVIHTPYAAYLRKRYLQSDRFERGCWMALCLSSGAWLVLVAISV